MMSVEIAEQRIEGINKSAGGRYTHATLDNFKASSDKQRAVLKDVRQFAADISQHVREGTGLILYGPSGTGKDHLIIAVAKLAILAGNSVRYETGPELLKRLTTKDPQQRYSESALISPDILVISDPLPARGHLTDWQIEGLYSVVDDRYRVGRPTWATLNIADKGEGEARLTKAIYDRLRDNAICVGCNWESYRQPRSQRL